MTKDTILDTILAHKRKEVEQRKSEVRLETLREDVKRFSPRDFISALKKPKVGPIALIAEVKKASPSAGIIRESFNPIEIAEAYETNGASCLSILTDKKFFQGDRVHLSTIRSKTSLPVLCKDFVIDPYQIFEARVWGADAILLIASVLDVKQIFEYRNIAHDLGMAALVEVHSDEEMNKAVMADADLIGINSRDLKTFRTDLMLFAQLASRVPSKVTLVAESGIKTPADVARVADAGARAVLVGETLMRSPDIGDAVRKLLGPA